MRESVNQTRMEGSSGTANKGRRIQRRARVRLRVWGYLVVFLRNSVDICTNIVYITDMATSQWP